jgi:hypothetical protein
MNDDPPLPKEVVGYLHDPHIQLWVDDGPEPEHVVDLLYESRGIACMYYRSDELVGKEREQSLPRAWVMWRSGGGSWTPEGPFVGEWEITQFVISRLGELAVGELHPIFRPDEEI